MNHVINLLRQEVTSFEIQNKTPLGPLPYDNWDFFLNDWQNEWVIALLSNENYFLFSIFIQENDINPSTKDTMLNLNFSYPTGWHIYYPLTQTDDYSLGSPLGDLEPPFESGEPFYYGRFFEGYPKEKSSYFEVNQKFTMSLGLHWVEKLSSFCTLNPLGDLVENLIIHNENNFSCILVKRDVLDKFLSFTNYCLARVFEFKQIPDVSSISAEHKEEKTFQQKENFKYKQSLFRSNHAINGIIHRGFDMVIKKNSYKQIVKKEAEQDRSHPPLKFIINDFKNNQIVETVLDSKHLATYFIQSDLPYETSPVFFKPEVLSKYKLDPEKYEIRQRTIICRGSWHLQTYDVNEAGQV